MTYQLDSSGECITTTPENVAQIADDLVERGHVVTTWADQLGSKFDLVWSYDATRIGRSSMVSPGPGKVFVGVVGKGCFGFQVGNGYLAPGYVSEKLDVSYGSAVPLAELLTSVRDAVASPAFREHLDVCPGKPS